MPKTLDINGTTQKEEPKKNTLREWINNREITKIKIKNKKSGSETQRFAMSAYAFFFVHLTTSSHISKLFTVGRGKKKKNSYNCGATSIYSTNNKSTAYGTPKAFIWRSKLCF